MKRIVLALLVLARSACSLSAKDLEIDWAIETQGAQVTCADVGASRVDMTLTSDTDGSHASFSFACTSDDGVVHVDYDTYDVTLTLEDANGNVLGTPIVLSQLDVTKDEVVARAVVFNVP